MRQAHVLIADPDPLVRRDVKTMLAMMGYAVLGESASGNQTLSLVRILHPNVLLLDLALVGTTPPERPDLLQTLAAEHADTAILVTGSGDNGSLASLGRSPALGFLSKPFRPPDLEAAISIALRIASERAALLEQIQKLSGLMEARRLVGRAKAILMEEYRMSEREAYRKIQSQSVALGKPPHEIALAIVTASEIAMGQTTPAPPDVAPSGRPGNQAEQARARRNKPKVDRM